MNHEISFNNAWLWIQFNVYEMDFSKSSKCVKDVQSGSTFGLPFKDVAENDIYFKYNDQSRRRKGCVIMQIWINKEQYDKLCASFPDKKDTYPWD